MSNNNESDFNDINSMIFLQLNTTKTCLLPVIFSTIIFPYTGVSNETHHGPSKCRLMYKTCHQNYRALTMKQYKTTLKEYSGLKFIYKNT